MPQFQHIYDGKNEGVALPSGERLDKAQENLGRTILDAEKIRLEEFRKNEDWLLKSTTVDLKALASAGAAATQAKYYDKFVEDTAKIYKQAGGEKNLSTDQKIEINKQRMFFEAEQNKLLGDQKKFEMEEALVNRDPRFDKKKWLEQKASKYITTGVFDNTPPPWQAKNLGKYFNDNKVKGTTYTEDKYETNIYGKKVYQPVVINGTRQEAEAHVENHILADPQLLEGAFEEFSSLPESKQMEYLADFDTNKDGSLSEQEKQTIPNLNAPTRDNPILKYAKEKYWQQVRTVTQSKETGAAPPSTSSGGTSNFKYGSGNWTKYTPSAPTKANLGADMNTDNYHSFGQFESYVIPVENIEVQDKNGNKVGTGQQNLLVKPTGYDEESGKFTFTVLQNYKSQNRRGNGDQIAIAKEDVPPEFREIEIVVDGKTVKIKDVPLKNKGASTSTESKYDKYKRK